MKRYLLIFAFLSIVAISFFGCKKDSPEIDVDITGRFQDSYISYGYYDSLEIFHYCYPKDTTGLPYTIIRRTGYGNLNIKYQATNLSYYKINEYKITFKVILKNKFVIHFIDSGSDLGGGTTAMNNVFVETKDEEVDRVEVESYEIK